MSIYLSDYSEINKWLPLLFSLLYILGYDFLMYYIHPKFKIENKKDKILKCKRNEVF